VEALVKNRMVEAGRAPGRETVPRPRDNEVVIFRDLLYAGLRFPLHPAVVDILRYFDIYLHQLTPNAILRLSVYMWICRTTKIKPSAEGFASAHQVHHQRRTVFEEEGDQSVEKDCQFGCLNFSYKAGVVSPVTAYRNKFYMAIVETYITSFTLIVRVYPGRTLKECTHRSWDFPSIFI
jgi:hypothetical protein